MDRAPELRDHLHVAWKRKWLILACMVVGAALAVAHTRTTTPIYSASTSLFVGQRQITTEQLAQGGQINQLSQQLLETYARVIKTTPIAARAIRAAQLPMSPPALAGSLVADPVPDTQLLNLSYKNPDPDLAVRAVNAVTQAFVTEIERIEGPSEGSDQPAIKVSIVQPALRPTRPVSPRPLRELALGLFLGAFGGLGLAFLLEYLDTTVKRREDIEERLGVPVLSAVPKIRTRVEEIYLEGDNQSAFAETFRKLRTAIQLYGSDRAVQTILVTSPFSGDGKTTTALNLAAVYAYAGHRTVLVEADLRRPSLHNLFPPSGELNGLALALLGRISVEQATLATRIPGLFCIPAAAIPPNPVELLAADRTRHILDELRSRFDTIVIDGPPILPVADSSTIAPRVDGTLLVARAKVTRRDRLREATQLVEKVGGRTLGVVLNAVPADASGGYYYYYYQTYGSRPERERNGGPSRSRWFRRAASTP